MSGSLTRRPRTPRRRTPSPRGAGEQLREEILDVATRLLDELAEDEALSMRAVAREVGVAATSVYLHFPDRDALVSAVMERSLGQLMKAIETAEAAAATPAEKLRARLLAHAHWAVKHVGLYKVLHESTLHLRKDLPFLRQAAEGTRLAVQRCFEAGLSPLGDPAEVALDLRTAVHGIIAMRINLPHMAWPPIESQIDRFLQRLVGIAPPRRG